MFYSAWRAIGKVGDLLLLLELVTQLEHLDFDLALAVVLENTLVWLSLAVPQAVKVFGVRRGAVARANMCKVALDVAGGSRASRCG